MSVLLSIRALSKVIDGRPVLSRLSLSLDSGAAAVIVGPSGSGKSTLLRIICGLEERSGGTIHLAGRALEGLRQAHGHLALCPQDAMLLPYLNVRDNLAFPMRAQRLAEPVISEYLRTILQKFELDALQHSFPAQLAPELRQGVLLARTMARPRALYLFDEPLAGFPDDVRRRLIGFVVAKLRQSGGAALWVSHDPADADYFGTAPLELRDGVLTRLSGMVSGGCPPPAV